MFPSVFFLTNWKIPQKSVIAKVNLKSHPISPPPDDGAETARVVGTANQIWNHKPDQTWGRAAHYRNRKEGGGGKGSKEREREEGTGGFLPR